MAPRWELFTEGPSHDQKLGTLSSTLHSPQEGEGLEMDYQVGEHIHAVKFNTFGGSKSWRNGSSSSTLRYGVECKAYSSFRTNTCPPQCV